MQGIFMTFQTMFVSPSVHFHNNKAWNR